MALRIKIDAENLVAGAQCLLPLLPPPTNEEIDNVLGKLCRAFEVPFTIENNARAIWRLRIEPIRREARGEYAREV